MGWLEGILEFLRRGPAGGKLDMNALFQGACDMHTIDKAEAIAEINALIKWQEERKKWHQDKTRQKMAAESGPGLANGEIVAPGSTTFRSSDFGLHEEDLAEMQAEDSSEEEEDEDEENGAGDPIAGERKRRKRLQDRLRRTAGEPVKPEVKQLGAMKEGFLAMLRMVLAE